MQQRRLLADHQDRVEAANCLELDHVLAETVLAGINDFFELRDDGFGATVDDGVNADRLTPHPVEVEAHCGIHRRATFCAGTLDQKQVSRRIGAYHSGFGRETIHQLQQRLRRHVLQGNDGDAVAGLRARDRGIDPAGADRIAERRQAVAGGVANKHDPADPQGIFQNKYNVGFGHRPYGHKAHGALHPRVDRVAGLQNVAQHHLGHGGDRRVFEIELKAVAG
ncbi:hypothetical protein GALL_481140 [mine drainage metagenome]|uniref:Uncharacterized protein n=1 Tax=mine drainage metagenome TaxID=410659 RepID=A0A1J5PF74_9ZZZZ